MVPRCWVQSHITVAAASAPGMVSFPYSVRRTVPHGKDYARFPLDHPDVHRFLTFLQGLDGRKKSAREAKQIAIDISKFLKFTDPQSNHPNWNRVVDLTKIREYLDMLQHTGACGVSGQLTKLDRLIHATHYLNLEIAGEKDATMSLRCSRTIARIQQWKEAL